MDPYYLTYKAESLGHHSEVILSGRRINDGMGKYIAQKSVKEMVLGGHHIAHSTVTILGLTFKENTPDIRNSKIVDIIRELESYGIDVQVHDPMVMKDEAEKEYNLKLKNISELKPAHALILGVSHKDFKDYTVDKIQELLVQDNPVVIGVRTHIKKKELDNVGLRSWYL